MMHRFAEKRGFILVLIVSLAAIIALLGSALVSLSRVESMAIDYNTHLSMARSNARAALDLALGDLQMFAGRDQIATALADGYRADQDQNFNDDATPTDSNLKRIYQPFWTGVWDDDIFTTDPTWLVTRPRIVGSNFDPTGGPLASPYVDPTDDVNDNIEYVTLVDSSTAEFVGMTGSQKEFNVAVPLDKIESDSVIGFTDDSTVGKYGYWIGGLGEKASYAIPYQVDSIDYDTYADLGNGTQNRLKQMIGQTHRILSVDPESTNNMALFPNLISDFQLRTEVAGSALIFGASMDTVRRGFHDYTTMNRGILINALDGGLKWDLSPRLPVGDNAVDDYFLAYSNYSEMEPDYIDQYSVRYPIKRKEAEGTLLDDMPAVAPIVTEFHMNFRVHVDRSDGNKLKVSYHGRVELWNPFNAKLIPESLGVNVSELPTMTVTFKSGDISQTPIEFSLDDVISAHLASVSRLSLMVLDLPASGLRPGQIIAYEGSGETMTDNDSVVPLSREEMEVSSVVFIENTEGVLDDDFVDISFSISSPNVTLLSASGDSLRSNSEDYLSGSITSHEIDDSSSNLFGYVWRVDDPLNTAGVWSDFDPRSSDFSLYLRDFDSDPTSSSNYDHIFVDGSVDLLGYNPTDPPYSGPVSLEFDVPLFELPRQEMISVGAFQHSEGPGGLPRLVGKVGSGVNEVFDKYFFSTVPQSTDTTWNLSVPLANPRNIIREGVSVEDLQTAGIDTAPYLLIDGAFNVNSTSVDAWTAILRSIRLGNWDYSDGSGGSHVKNFSSESQFVYFSQSAEESWIGTYGENANDKMRESFRKGLRSFSNAELRSLSEQIVEQVRSKIDLSGPFRNLEEFVDSGILDTAISNVGLNSDATEFIPDTPRFLTQGTILNSLAPFLTTRSDTFLIRAYGDSRNPSDENKIVARAYCEAVVQRLPDKHPSESDSDPMTATDNGSGVNDGFGRQFEVIAFRWMTGEEI